MFVHYCSLIGKRDSNEDQHDIFINIDAKDNDKKKINFFAIYDGHGGKSVSKYLKNNLSNYFTSELTSYDLENKNLKKYIEKVFDFTQMKLERLYKNISYNIGSTALIIIFYYKKNNIYYTIANCGDCRSVLCNENNQVIQLTIDHKPNIFNEKKRIEELGGEIEFDGYDWRISGLSVSKSFGDLDALPYVSHKPDIFYDNKLKKNDKFIILGCDGLWDVIDNQDAVNFILSNLNKINSKNNQLNNNQNNISYLLANYAINKGSTDNISIIIIFF